MPVILHNNPSQTRDCLVGLVRYSQRIISEGGREYERLGSFPSVVRHIRASPYQPDDGSAQRGVTACSPIQRARVWPRTFNCFEATAHAIGAAMFYGLSDGLDWHVFDRNLGPRTRHVWPVCVEPATARGWIIVLDSVVPRQHRRILANAWYSIPLGVVHKAGRVVLSVYGMDKAGQQVEKVWGDRLPDWARDGGGQKKPAPTPPRRQPTPPTKPPPPQDEGSKENTNDDNE